jgi:hypothetical protein
MYGQLAYQNEPLFQLCSCKTRMPNLGARRPHYRLVRDQASRDGGHTFHPLHEDDIAFHTCTYPKPKTRYVEYQPQWRINRQADWSCHKDNPCADIERIYEVFIELNFLDSNSLLQLNCIELY